MVNIFEYQPPIEPLTSNVHFNHGLLENVYIDFP